MHGPFGAVEVVFSMKDAALLAVPAVLTARAHHGLRCVQLADTVAPIVLFLLHQVALTLHHLNRGAEQSQSEKSVSLWRSANGRQETLVIRQDYDIHLIYHRDRCMV